MSLYNLCVLVMGFALPLLVALVLKENWRKEVKTAVAILSCTLCATIFCFFQHKLDGTDLVGTILAVNALSGAIFQAIWKPLGFLNPLEAFTLNLQFLQNLTLGKSLPLGTSPVASSPSTNDSDNEQFTPSTDA